MNASDKPVYFSNDPLDIRGEYHDLRAALLANQVGFELTAPVGASQPPRFGKRTSANDNVNECEQSEAR